MTTLKRKQLVAKLKIANTNFFEISYKIFNIIWILKLIYGYDTERDKIKVRALEWPVRTLLIYPSLSVSLILIVMGLIIYYEDLLKNEFLPYVFIGLILIAISFIGLPIRYFISPVNLSVRQFFKKNGRMNTVIEFQWVTKLLLAAIPIMIVSAVLISLFNIVPLGISEKNILFLRLSLIIITVIATTISMSAILKFTLLLIQKDFRFYLSKSSFELSMNVENEYEKIQYVLFGFNAYNKYLRRTMKLQFSEISKIMQHVISDSNESMNANIKEIHNSIDVKNIQLIRLLNEKISTEYTQNTILTNISLKDKIIEWSPLIAIMTSLSISFAQYAPSVLQLIPTLQDLAPK